MNHCGVKRSLTGPTLYYTNSEPQSKVSKIKRNEFHAPKGELIRAGSGTSGLRVSIGSE